MVARNNRVAGMFSDMEKEGILNRAKDLEMSINKYVRFVLINARFNLEMTNK